MVKITPEGPASLDSVVTFEDGTEKQVRDCNRAELETLRAWSAYKSADATRMAEMTNAALSARRRQNLKAVSA